MQLMEGSVEVRDIWEDWKKEENRKREEEEREKASDAKTKRTTGDVEQKVVGWSKLLSESQLSVWCGGQLSVSFWDPLAWDKEKP